MSEPTRGEAKDTGHVGDPGERAPMFQAAAPPPSSGGRAVLIAVVAAVAIGGVIAVRALIPSTPAPVPVATSKPPPKPLDIAEGAMVQVPGGTFQMGSADGAPDEKPIHEVQVAPFSIDVTEVTVAAYTKCVNAGKCTAPDTGMYCNWQKPDKDRHPVNCVEWQQAGEYCSFVGKRLPSEEEWEYAARGAEGRKYPWGAAPPGAQLCWNGEGTVPGKGNQQGTCPVASYPSGATPIGAYDMAGNVWEWTADTYCPYGQKGCADERHVIRGGAWNNSVPQYMAAQNRAKEAAKSKPENVGFRCLKPPLEARV